LAKVRLCVWRRLGFDGLGFEARGCVENIYCLRWRGLGFGCSFGGVYMGRAVVSELLEI
jgi:hypothetical protein